MEPLSARQTSEERIEATADRLHSVAIHLLRTLRRQDEASGVTAPHLSALSVLVFGGPRSIGELAAAEGVRAPSMTRIVDNLERDGLATRGPDPTDGRAVRVSATERGRQVLLEGRGRRVAELADRLRDLPRDEQEVVARATAVLERMLRARPAAADLDRPATAAADAMPEPTIAPNQHPHQAPKSDTNAGPTSYPTDSDP